MTQIDPMKTALSLMVARALMSDRALAVEVPKYFHGTWCTESDTLKDWAGYGSEAVDCQNNSVEITATKVSIPVLSVSCIVRQVTKFDVCPWGMIFRNRERAGTGSKAVSDKPVESQLSHRTPMHERP